MFKVGTRVQVTDEKEAYRTGAKVHKGDKGTVIEAKVNDSYFQEFSHVHIDNTKPALIWSIPVKALRRIHRKKEVKV